MCMRTRARARECVGGRYVRVRGYGKLQSLSWTALTSLPIARRGGTRVRSGFSAIRPGAGSLWAKISNTRYPSLVFYTIVFRDDLHRET